MASGTLFFARVFVKIGQSRSKGVKMMSKWLKIGSKGVEMAQNRPKMAQSRVNMGSKWLKIGSKWPKVGSKWIKTGQRWLKMARVGPKPAVRSKWGPKPSARSKWGSGSGQSLRRCRNGGQNGSKWLKMAPKCSLTPILTAPQALAAHWLQFSVILSHFGPILTLLWAILGLF